MSINLTKHIFDVLKPDFSKLSFDDGQTSPGSVFCVASHYAVAPLQFETLPFLPMLALEDRFVFSHGTLSATPAATAKSPTLDDTVSFISGVSGSGKIVRDSALTWNNDTPATYSNTSEAHKWGAGTAGTAGGTVDYYFNSASHWTSAEKAVFTACLTLWSDVANIHFALTTNKADAQITFTRGDERSGAYTEGGWSYNSSSTDTVGSKSIATTTSETISIDTSTPGFGPVDGNFATTGGYVWDTILHEEGHALGLDHAGPYNGTVDPETQQYSAYDMRLWSIMSYIDPSQSAKYSSQYPVKGTDWGIAADGYGNVPTTMMPLDVLAAQRLYGASTSSAFSGGQTFGFNCNISDVTKEFYDFTVNKTPVVGIWDSGTGNTLDLSGFSAGSKIDLKPGTFSSCDGLKNNIAIDFNTKIDSAFGGAGNDTIIGNADGDKLYPENGKDTVTGGTGNDIISFAHGMLTASDKIDGGAGKDEIYLSGVNYTGPNRLVMNSTTLQNIETLQLQGGHNYDIATASATVASGETLTVDASALNSAHSLTFDGSAETDGHFTITGGDGADVLTGGSQSDSFVYTSAAQSTSTGFDTINAFNFSSDRFDVAVTIGKIDTARTHAISTGSFDSDIAAAASSTHLVGHSAMLITASGASFAGDVFLVVDLNGTAGYQAGQDLVIELHNITGTGTLGTSNFI